MSKKLILLLIPGLREKDLAAMPQLRNLTAAGSSATLVPSFPCVTCPVEANMTTGTLPRSHGVVANGLYFRDQRRFEMWTSPAGCIEAPQIWDVLRRHDASITSAVWFPLHSKECGADYVCTPAPIHNPDGSESLWCYTKPTDLYGTLRDTLGHFPLKHFWGPLAGIPASQWIADSAVHAAGTWKPSFFTIYLPHLDYAAQRTGPESEAAGKAVAELDQLVGKLACGMAGAYGGDSAWLAVGEYAITPVSHVTYPNRVLRDAGLLAIRESEEGEVLDPATSRAWALADHQLAHVFVNGGDPQLAEKAAGLFRSQQGVAKVLVGDQRSRYGLDHARSGDVVLVSTPDSWMAYYYWLSDEQAPKFARSVDIHRKPGYDPVELCFDPATKSIPLDATLIRGSHGAPAVDPSQQTIAVASEPSLLPDGTLRDLDVFGTVARHFGLAMQNG